MGVLVLEVGYFILGRTCLDKARGQGPKKTFARTLAHSHLNESDKDLSTPLTTALHKISYGFAA